MWPVSTTSFDKKIDDGSGVIATVSHEVSDPF